MFRSCRWLVLVLALLAGCAGDGDRGAAQTRQVTLALDFQPNAVHAGVYTATAEGLDRERGLELTVRAPSASTDSLKLLAAGRADLAVVDIHDLGLARERGADVVGVGALVQRPLAAVIAAPG
ncbi:MAG: ABC transporter substrate-binding protein, partial [Thermoleophilaceae bacterium]|nr:ABC transporter substrate-binding protein [Thermoleophilaceae bacterium]